MKLNKKLGVRFGVVLCSIICIWGGINYAGYRFTRNWNKSGQRFDSYRIEVTDRRKYAHFSIDDVVEIFQDLTENQDVYNSIFDNKTLSWLRYLHEEYGVVVSGYIYFKTADFSISTCTSRFRTEFENNSDWLRFGFHSIHGGTSYKDASPERITADYTAAISELVRIVGHKSIDNVIRLHCYEGNKLALESLMKVNDEPIVGLLTAEDKRKSYYLDAKTNRYIYCHDEYQDSNGLHFISTDLRAELITEIDNKLNELETSAWNNQLSDFEFFTHEWIIDEPVKNNVERLCEWLKENDYVFTFFEERVACESTGGL